MAFKEWTEDNSANETEGKTVTEVGAGTMTQRSGKTREGGACLRFSVS